MLLSLRCALVDPSGKTYLFNNATVGVDTVAYYIYEDKVKAIPATSNATWDDSNVCDPSQSLEVEPQSPMVSIVKAGVEIRDDISEMIFSPGRHAHMQADMIELTSLSAHALSRSNV